MKYHAIFDIFEKQQNSKLSSAAKYRWRFIGIFTFFSTSTLKLNSILTNFSFSTIKYYYSCRHVVQWSLY